MAKTRKKRVNIVFVIIAGVVAIAGTALMVTSLMSMLPETSPIWSFVLGLVLVLVAGWAISRWS